MKNKVKSFTVLVGDLVRSRHIVNRREVARLIHDSLKKINKDFDRDFFAPLTLTRGIDELSGVLKSSHVSYQVCRQLNDRVAPSAFRFAIVTGPLDIALASRDAGKMDGPAFHQASDLIQKAKRADRPYSFRVGFSSAEIDPPLNEMTNLIYILCRGWSDHQRAVVRLYDRWMRQEVVADKLGITQQAVSEALRKAHYKEIKNAENLIDQMLRGQ